MRRAGGPEAVYKGAAALAARAVASVTQRLRLERESRRLIENERHRFFPLQRDIYFISLKTHAP